MKVLGRWAAVVALAATMVTSTGCIGSGKVAPAGALEPLPAGLTVVSDESAGCRAGESGFDYRFVVVAGTEDLSAGGPLLTSLRAAGYYHSIGLVDDLPWISVGYQHSQQPLRAEIGLLRRYLERVRPHQGPDPASLPTSVREHPENHVLVALRPTDFACTTPL